MFPESQVVSRLISDPLLSGTESKTYSSQKTFNCGSVSTKKCLSQEVGRCVSKTFNIPVSLPVQRRVTWLDDLISPLNTPVLSCNRHGLARIQVSNKGTLSRQFPCVTEFISFLSWLTVQLLPAIHCAMYIIRIDWRILWLPHNVDSAAIGFLKYYNFDFRNCTVFSRQPLRCL